MLDLDFLKPREKFLLLEIAPKRTSGLLLSVDKEKNIRAEKFWEDFSFKKVHGDPLKSLRKRQIIVSAHPEFVASIICPVSLERDEANAQKPLNITELEGLFSQALGRLQSKYRREASLRLEVEELDVVLIGAKAGSFKVDGHMVLNPLGFHGRTPSAILELTFTTRQIFDDLKEFFKAQEGFFFTGSPRAALSILSRLESLPLNLVLAENGRSFYFMLDKAAWGHAIKEEKVPWSLGGIFEAISRALALSPKLTFAVYEKYLEKEMSDNMSNALGRVIKPEKDALLEELKKLNPRGRVYVHSRAPLSFAFPFRLGRAVMDELPLETALERLGFRLEFGEWPFAKGEIFMRLAPFFEFYFDRSGSEINSRLRRRLHWLIQ